jgi:hypothetical protein
MSKILLITFYDENGDKQIRAFVGNEFAPDPTYVQGIVEKTLDSSQYGEVLFVHQQDEPQPDYEAEVLRVLRRNGYEEYNARQIALP